MKNLVSIVLILYIALFQAEDCFSVEKDVVLPIDRVFEGVCISNSGCKILSELTSNLNNAPILIEVFCDEKLNYDYTWEIANIYAYKFSKCLIDFGYNQNRIRYIGYGNLGFESSKLQNVIKISIQKIEPLVINSTTD